MTDFQLEIKKTLEELGLNFDVLVSQDWTNFDTIVDLNKRFRMNSFNTHDIQFSDFCNQLVTEMESSNFFKNKMLILKEEIDQLKKQNEELIKYKTYFDLEK